MAVHPLETPSRLLPVLGFVLTRATSHHVPEDGIPHRHHCENLNSYTHPLSLALILVYIQAGEQRDNIHNHMMCSFTLLKRYACYIFLSQSLVAGGQIVSEYNCLFLQGVKGYIEEVMKNQF
jgi:hypothetical protein